ncbi:hypothetical protein MMC25_003303 [Agyrium rufum]|nr:hypothetical protein [Agyrium rufum]
MASNNAFEPLNQELLNSLKEAMQSSAPVLTHLNQDSSWLLQLPSATPGRSWYNILIDPWLQGSQSDIAGWFSTQSHVVAPSVQSIPQLNRYLAEIEGVGELAAEGTPQEPSDDDPSPADHRSMIDIVALSFEYTDHTHKETLLQLPKPTPIFARFRAAEIVRSWKHFDNIVTISSLQHNGSDWTRCSEPPLPPTIGIFELAPGEKSAALHCAMVVVYRSGSDDNDSTKAIIYSPHGIKPTHVQPLLDARPRIQPSVILHGMDEIGALGQKISLGARNGLEVQRLCKAKYFLPTHDEVKKAGGIFAPFMRRKVLTYDDILAEARAPKDGWTENMRFVALKNGESLVLAE